MIKSIDKTVDCDNGVKRFYSPATKKVKNADGNNIDFPVGERFVGEAVRVKLGEWRYSGPGKSGTARTLAGCKRALLSN